MSTFQRRHYEPIADVIRSAYAEIEGATVPEVMAWTGLDPSEATLVRDAAARIIKAIAWNLAATFTTDNSRFDRDKFFIAALGHIPSKPDERETS